MKVLQFNQKTGFTDLNGVKCILYTELYTGFVEKNESARLLILNVENSGKIQKRGLSIPSFCVFFEKTT